MTAIDEPAQSPDEAEVNPALGISSSHSLEARVALAEMLQATASSFAAARAVMETAARTAFAFFCDADAAERALLMSELSESTLVHDAILAGYAKALDDGAAGGNTLAKSLGYRSVADLLQHELGRRKSDTEAMVRLGEVLSGGDYPSLAVAVEDGKVSLQQAGVIVRVLDEESPRYHPEDIERAEVAATEFAIGSETALPMKPEQLQKIVRMWFKKLQPEKTELDAIEQFQTRECSYGTTRNGMIRVRALLPPEEGAAVVQFLDANAAPRVRFRDIDSSTGMCCCTDPENRCGAARSRGTNGIGRTGSGDLDENADSVVTAHCDACVADDPRTRKQKTADAFSSAFAVAAKSKDTSTQGGACPTLTVTIPIGELDKHAQGVPALATIQRTEEVVPAQVAARILCDGAVQAAVTGADGEVLHWGRARRVFTPAQRAALALVYPTCAVADCDIPAVWSEAHHVTWWSRSGPTDVENGILICNYHHHEVHAGNLDIVPDRREGANGRRWRVRRKARTRSGTALPEQSTEGTNTPPDRQTGRRQSEPPPEQQSWAGSSPGSGHPGRRGDRSPSEDKAGGSNDDPAEAA